MEAIRRMRCQPVLLPRIVSRKSRRKRQALDVVRREVSKSDKPEQKPEQKPETGRYKRVPLMSSMRAQERGS